MEQCPEYEKGECLLCGETCALLIGQDCYDYPNAGNVREELMEAME